MNTADPKSESLNSEDEKRLVSVLDRTINFVKYAEAKNGAVAALSSALIAGIIKSPIGEGYAHKVLLLASLLIFAISALVAITSFIPKLSATRNSYTGSSGEQPNPFHFAHSASLTEEELLEEFYVDGKKKRHHLEFLYAQQIKINSKIACQKLVKFNYAVILITIGLALLVASEFFA